MKNSFLATLAIGTQLVASPAFSQSVERWTTQCSEATCTVSLTLTNAATGMRAATFFVLEDSEPGIILGIVTPLGVALKPGARLVMEGKDLNLEYDVCFPDGCRAFNNAADDFLANQTMIEALYFAQSLDKPLSIDVPLAGLEGALGAARDQLK